MSIKCTKIEPISEIDKLLYEYYTNDLRHGYVEVDEEKTCMPMKYACIAEKIENFQVHDSDVFIISHPKAGTTWGQEMIWLILNDLNFEKAKEPLNERSPFLELECVFDYSQVVKSNPNFIIPPLLNDSINMTSKYENPRCIKTHLSWNLLPKEIRENTKQPKLIYIARNPKDVCISFYHHSKLLEGFKGDFEIYYKLFLAGRVNRGPYWTNVLSYWNRRHQSNILFLKYEDMKKDLRSIIKKIATFLGKELDQNKMSILENHLSFESMKNNPSIGVHKIVEFNKPFLNNESGNFMRSGTVGGYKTEMTPEINKKFDDWIEENSEGTGLTFQYKI